MEPGLIAALGAATATTVGLIKTVAPSEPPRWLSQLAVLLVAGALVALKAADAGITAPLDLVLSWVDVVVAAMGGRAALQAVSVQTTGKPLELTKRAVPEAPLASLTLAPVTTSAGTPVTARGFTLTQAQLAVCPICGDAVPLPAERTMALVCGRGLHRIALDVPYSPERPLDFHYRASVTMA